MRLMLWLMALKCFFKVEPLYEGGSFRPSSFAITDIIDGEETVTFLLNTAKEM